jgi:ligand-binding sensor domain-containing protein
MPRQVLLCGILALVVCAADLPALDPSLALTQYVRRGWRAPAHLPHDNVTSMLQTRDRYLWIGTVEGLVRFDGRRSLVFDGTTTPEIANNWIKSLAEDQSGRLWIATLGGGLVSLEDGRFTRYGAAEGLPSDIVLSVYVDRRDRLWVGTSGAGFVRLEDGRFVRPPGFEAYAESIVKDFLEDGSGTLWIATDRGALRLAENGPQLLGTSAGLTDEHVMALAETDEGVWIGTETGGLVRWRDGETLAITPADGLAYERVWSLDTVREVAVWIGTDGGGLQRW